MASLSLLKAGTPPRLAPVSASVEAPLIYQPYFKDEQRAQLDPRCTPLDGRFNTGPSTREYELFQHILRQHEANGFRPDQFWGLVSSKFEGKSPVPLETFLAEAAQAQAHGYDCYVLNPMIGNAAIFINVWEQGVVCGHTGMSLVHQFLAERGFPVNNLEGPDTFAFCNYVCGNLKFWSSYFLVVGNALDALEAEAEKGTPVGLAYRGSGDYWRDKQATMRPFIAERLLSVYLSLAKSSGAINVAYHAPTEREFDYKFGVRLASVLHPLHVLKTEAVADMQPTTAKTWLQRRSVILEENPALVWQMDDPPSWMPVAHKTARA